MAMPAAAPAVLAAAAVVPVARPAAPAAAAAAVAAVPAAALAPAPAVVPAAVPAAVPILASVVAPAAVLAAVPVVASVAAPAVPPVEVQRRPSAVLRDISLEYDYDELAAATLQWHPSRRLSAGACASVFRGEMKDGSEVAVKALDLNSLGQRGQAAESAAFLEEVQLLSVIRHPNLVTLLGWCKKDSQRYLVYELLGGGSAFLRLQNCKQPGGAQAFHWHERLSVCIDAATGLSRMHSSGALHRDIKSSHILLDRHGTAKMADFGLSCTSGHSTLGAASGNISPGYTCPVYQRTGQFTEGSEVYSFGIVMLEMLTGLAPVSTDPQRPNILTCPIANTVAPHQSGAAGRCAQNLDASAGWPPQLATELAALALRCVDIQDEAQRPRMGEVVRALRSLGERFPRPSAAPPSAAAPQRPPQQPGCPGGLQESGGGIERRASVVAASPTPFFYLECVKAACGSLEQLPLEKRQVPLRLGAGAVGAAGSQSSISIGRVHQPELFEAWLPDEQLRNCISRTAFELSRGPGGDGLGLVVRGVTPLSVDRRPAAQGSALQVRLGAEIGFHYNSPVQQEPFLLLRLQASSPATAAAPAQGVGAGRAVAAPFAPAVAAALVVGSAAAPVAAASSVAAAQAAAPEGCRWRLACLHAEGLSGEHLQALPPGSRQLELPSGTTLLGRERQTPLFEALLAAVPQLLTFISRTHLEIVARQDSDRLSVTNVSANPVYVDREPLAKGETCTLTQDQVLSFARPEGPEGNVRHIHFLVMQVQASNGAVVLAARDPDCRDRRLTALAAAPEPQRAPPAFSPSSSVSSAGLQPMVSVELTPPAPAAAPVPMASVELGAAPAVSAAAAPLPAPAVVLAASPAGEQKRAPLPPPLHAPPPGEPPLLPPPSPSSLPPPQPSVLPPPSPTPRIAAPAPAAAVAVPAPELGAPVPAAAVAPATVAVALLEGTGNGAPSRQLAAGAPGPSGYPGSPSAASRPRSDLPLAPAPAPAPSDDALAGTVEGAQLHAALGSGLAAERIQQASGGSSPSSPARRAQRPSLEVRPAIQLPVAPRASSSTCPRPVSSSEEMCPEAHQGEILLEISGEGVNDVPSEKRRIGPISLVTEPLLVGRRHQTELLRRVVKKECLQFISRDHFQISREGSGFWLHALTPNPIWIFRGGEEPRELASGEVSLLNPGDIIALGTGSEDYFTSAEDARRRLAWRFRVLGPDGLDGSPAAAASPASSISDPCGAEPASPGGVGPRVSVGPWSQQTRVAPSTSLDRPPSPQRPVPTLGDGLGALPSSQRPAPTLGAGLDSMPSSFSTAAPSLADAQPRAEFRGSSFGTGSGSGGGMLSSTPPAFGGREDRRWSAPAVQQREERPSELCSPVPRLLGSCGMEPVTSTKGARGREMPVLAEQPPQRGLDTSDALLPHFGGNGSLLEGALEDSPPNFGSAASPFPQPRRAQHLHSLEARDGLSEDFALYHRRRGTDPAGARREQYRSADSYSFQR